MSKQVDRVRLLSKLEGVYTRYGFLLLDRNPRKYLLLTKLPNWQTPDINLGDEGLVEYEVIFAGMEYYKPETGTIEKYQYDAVYFKDFIKLSDQAINSNPIIL